MIDRKRIEDITVEDLERHRWCYHMIDDEDDMIEYVVSDRHPDFSGDVPELELAVFEFANGALAKGLYDGSEAFNIMTDDAWYAFWYGSDAPEAADIERLTQYLADNHLQLPVTARAKWSGTEKSYRGIQYLNDSGDLVEVAI